MPTIGQAGAELFTRTLLAAFTWNTGPPAHASLVRDQLLAETRATYQEGYMASPLIYSTPWAFLTSKRNAST